MSFSVAKLREGHDRFLAEQTAMVRGALYDAGVVALSEVATHPQFTPRTGALQKATKTRLVRGRNGQVIRISNAKAYAGSIEHGSRPHKITARSGKALRFSTSSGIVYRRSVNHPGNRPYRFLSRATDVAGERLERRLVDGMTRLSRNRF